MAFEHSWERKKKKLSIYLRFNASDYRFLFFISTTVNRWILEAKRKTVYVFNVNVFDLVSRRHISCVHWLLHRCRREMVQMNAIAVPSIRLYPWHLHVYFPLNLVPLIASIQLHIYIIYALVTSVWVEWRAREKESDREKRNNKIMHTKYIHTSINTFDSPLLHSVWFHSIRIDLECVCVCVRVSVSVYVARIVWEHRPNIGTNEIS